MRLTIIPVDGFVCVDNVSKYQPLDLSNCGIPTDIHALQWYDTKGWIEFSDDGDPFTPRPANELIDELPLWATNCVKVWNAWIPPEPQPQPDTTVEATEPPKASE